MSLKQWRQSEDVIKYGKWFGKDIFEPNADGTTPEFRLRPASPDNKEYERAQLVWRRKHPKAMRRRSQDVWSASDKMLEYAFVEACVAEWRNFQEDDGSAIEYNMDNVRIYMRDYPALRRELQTLASDDGEYLEDEVNDIVGERPATSSTPLSAVGTTRVAAREEQASRMGVPHEKKEPEWRDPPVGLSAIFEAWDMLQGDRAQSMGEYVPPLPYTAIHFYCEGKGWRGGLRRMIITVLREMDRVFCSHYNDKDKPPKKEDEDADSLYQEGGVFGE